MNLLILKGFNNYFNRIIKRYTTLSDYTTNSEDYYYFSNINFNPNDGITTTQVIGSENQKQIGDGIDPIPLAWEHEGNPDYLIAYETEQVGGASTNVIKSRWFIVESVRTRNGQYSLKLKRDTIADNLDTLLSCPAFIKKGTVSDDNPLIVNSEGINVNQIKSGETLLKDKTGSAWIVGYMAKNAPAATITEQIPDETQVYYETIENLASDLNIDSTILGAILTQNTDNPSYFVNDNIEIIGWLNYAEGTPLEIKIVAGSQNFLSSFTYSSSATLSHSNVNDCFARPNRIPYPELHTYWQTACETYKTQIKNAWQSIVGKPLLTKPVFDKLQEISLLGTLIYKQGRYFKIKIGGVNGPTNTKENYYSSAISLPFSNVCEAYMSSFTGVNQMENLHRGKIFVVYNELEAYFYLEEVTNTSDIPGITVKMSSTRNVIQNQPYDMFAIPYSNISAEDSVDTYDVNGEYAQRIAMALLKNLTSSNVYDIQLLPYCPIPQIASENGIDVSSLTSGVDYDWIDYTGAYLEHYEETGTSSQWLVTSPNVYRCTIDVQTEAGVDLTDIDDWGVDLESEVAYIALSKTTNATQAGTKVDFQVYVDALGAGGAPTGTLTAYFWWNQKTTGTIHRSIVIYPKNNSFSTSLDYNLSLKDSMKIDSQTDLYRLVSPNYQGSFDFNVAKNGGTVKGFVAECTYKPYTPYIKVAPNFAWLYGSNYGDCRGLICGGDFSIGIINSAWEQYQLQNKNYQNIFNREIQNLDVNQSIQRTQQYASGGLNIARDTIAGGVAGGLATGSPYGAIAGAVLGGVGSGIGYGIDMNLMEKSLQEQRQFAIDKYKMQLGNIQALPYTLTKVGAFNINSKVFPFLEYYTCSEQEKEALKIKIQYEGMTVGVVDTLGNYMNGGYVQADLIRNDAIIEDSHQLDDIYIELTKGVYM